MTGIFWVDVFVIVTIVGGGLALMWKTITLLLRKTRRLTHLVDDLVGEPARPGVPARPGIFERLATIEAELKPNHGTSLRDVADRLERGLMRVEDGLAEHLRHHHPVPVQVVSNVEEKSEADQ